MYILKGDDDMIALNYGKYSVPAKLSQLIALQQDLNNQKLSKYGDLLGYYFALERLDVRYLNTPLDVIPFARPGADGIHFGFLTDFGQTRTLDDAYIVRVSPMDFDDPVKIVARNLHDFIRIIFYYPCAMDMLDITQSKYSVEQWLEKYSDISDEKKEVRNWFQQAFQPEPIKCLFEYLHSVSKERESKIVIKTEDGIGVVIKTSEVEEQLFDFNGLEYLHLADVKHFFTHSSDEAKLAFFRDAQSKGLTFEHHELKAYLKEQLLLLHLNDEAERIVYP